MEMEMDAITIPLSEPTLARLKKFSKMLVGQTEQIIYESLVEIVSLELGLKVLEKEINDA